MNNELEIISSIGIEMEFMLVDRSGRRFSQEFNSLLPRFKAEHDASCETRQSSLGNIPVEFKSKNAQAKFQNLMHRSVFGGEIVSPILQSNSPDWMKDIINMCDVLSRNGEIPSYDDNRGSFHVHVNLSKDVPYYVLINLLRTIGSLEAILFRLGGMGKLNRGHTNEYIYQRPFLGKGPPVVNQQTNSVTRNVPCLNYDDLLESKTKTEFLYRYGNILKTQGKYVTPRYMCVNFHSILRFGSIEFRTANKTLNPSYIISWTNLCKAIVEESFKNRDFNVDGNLRPLYENRVIDNDELNHVLNFFPTLDNDTKDILNEIWYLSETPLFNNSWVYSHLENPTKFVCMREFGNYIPKKVSDDESITVVVPETVHNIGNNERENRAAPVFGNINDMLFEARIAPPRQRVIIEYEDLLEEIRAVMFEPNVDYIIRTDLPYWLKIVRVTIDRAAMDFLDEDDEVVDSLNFTIINKERIEELVEELNNE